MDIEVSLNACNAKLWGAEGVPTNALLGARLKAILEMLTLALHERSNNQLPDKNSMFANLPGRTRGKR